MAGSERLVLESCNSTWVFEPDRSRFRRVPRDVNVDAPVPATDWSTYFKLEVDPETDAFVVALNEEGTRLLRSFRHHEPCPHCADEVTTELSLQAVRDKS